jgi:hypothetical protein
MGTITTMRSSNIGNLLLTKSWHSYQLTQSCNGIRLLSQTARFLPYDFSAGMLYQLNGLCVCGFLTIWQKMGDESKSRKTDSEEVKSESLFCATFIFWRHFINYRNWGWSSTKASWETACLENSKRYMWIVVRFPAEEMYFSLYRNVHTGSGPHLASI